MNTHKKKLNKSIIIAGPCAAESSEQILASIRYAKIRDIDFMRTCLWKPRTKPGFDGLGEKGMNLLIKVAESGINPATEVLTPEHAQKVMDEVFSKVPNIKLLLWIGARNQNHYIQREIARVVAKDKRVFLLIKNQPWVSEDHWEGIIEHVLEGGIDKENLILCHRGFTPNGNNHNGYRNMPDYAMAMRIKNKTGLPMIFDPSHTGGTAENVLKIMDEAVGHQFDGIMVEVHPNPKAALTDAKQQLTWKQFDKLLEKIKYTESNKPKTSLQKDHSISIGIGLIKDINLLVDFSRYTKAVIVTDKNIPTSLVQNLKTTLSIETSIVMLDTGEQQKDLENIQKVWRTLQNFGCDRKSLVINIGGGVIGDIGGFAAATFMRGIDFLQIPTTLLAQADASIGGKVGINFLGIKNLIGSFQQPIAVIIDIDTLSTLPKREFVSGFGEIIKHGVITDKEYFQFVTSKKPQEFSQEELVAIIKRSCQIKTDIVSRDEKENGLRKLLNFGHTIGHAIESLSQDTNHPLLHGEAVSIGMVAEGQISKLLGLFSEEEYAILEQSIIQAGLPTKASRINANEVMGKIKSDKKNENGKINWTLLQGIGKAIYNQEVDDAIVRKVL